jgi:hypothetical protein
MESFTVLLLESHSDPSMWGCRHVRSDKCQGTANPGCAHGAVVPAGVRRVAAHPRRDLAVQPFARDRPRRGRLPHHVPGQSTDVARVPGREGPRRGATGRRDDTRRAQHVRPLNNRPGGQPRGGDRPRRRERVRRAGVRAPVPAGHTRCRGARVAGQRGVQVAGRDKAHRGARGPDPPYLRGRGCRGRGRTVADAQRRGCCRRGRPRTRTRHHHRRRDADRAAQPDGARPRPRRPPGGEGPGHRGPRSPG